LRVLIGAVTCPELQGAIHAHGQEISLSAGQQKRGEIVNSLGMGILYLLAKFPV